jgi:hypothetical protein
MYIDHEIIDAAAQLLAHGATEGPIDDQAEASGLDERQTLILEDLLGSLVPLDLHRVLREAGERLDEDDYPENDDSASDAKADA